MKKDDIKNSSDLFFYKAQIDLHTSKYLLEGIDDGKLEVDFELIYFHLQQCAEKLLKSLLSKHKIRIFKTHDIADLNTLLNENNINTIEGAKKMENLTEYAIEGRYAILHDDLHDADQYVKILDELLLYVSNTIHNNHNHTTKP